MILDAGAFIAVERNDRMMVARLLAAHAGGDELRTHPMVVAQVWRDPGGRQARLARLLRAVHVLPIDEELGRRCGELLGKAGTSDPIDAGVALLATEGETIVTSDPDDLGRLADAVEPRVLIVAC